MKKCKTKGCKAMVEGTRCGPCRVAWNAQSKAAYVPRGGGKRQCQKCFLRGHRIETCTWEPSIRADYMTPAQAAKREAARA